MARQPVVYGIVTAPASGTVDQVLAGITKTFERGAAIHHTSIGGIVDGIPSDAFRTDTWREAIVTVYAAVGHAGSIRGKIVSVNTAHATCTRTIRAVTDAALHCKTRRCFVASLTEVATRCACAGDAVGDIAARINAAHGIRGERET